MSAFEDARALIAPALKDAGIWTEASTMLPGCTEPTIFAVGFRRPDVEPFDRARSTDYEIEYQHHDAPTLAEGAEVIVDQVLYRVRETPTVQEGRGDDGFWRVALLTKSK